MLMFSNTGYTQNYFSGSGTAFNGNLRHTKSVIIGGDFEPVTNLQVHTSQSGGLSSNSLTSRLLFTTEISAGNTITDGFSISFFESNLNADYVNFSSNSAPLFFEIAGHNSLSVFSANIQFGDTNILGTTVSNWPMRLTYNADTNNGAILKSINTNGDLDWYFLQDEDSTNELQTLSIANGELSISNGNTIPLSDLSTNIWQQNPDNDAYYNTGNVGIGIINPTSNLHIHSALTKQNPQNKGFGIGNEIIGGGSNISQELSTNLQLTTANTGETATDGLLLQLNDFNATLNLQENGNMSFITNKHAGFYLNQNGNTGIGVETPQSTLHIHNPTTATSDGGNNDDDVIGKTGETTTPIASTIQLTNVTTGSGQNNGLFISEYQNNGIINQNEAGYFDIRIQDQTALKIKADRKVGIGTDNPEAKLTIESEGAYYASSASLHIKDKTNRGTVMLESEQNKPVDFVFKTNGLPKVWLSTRSEADDYRFDIFTNPNNTQWPKIVMSILQNGNIGIGTSTPNDALDVNGRVIIREGWRGLQFNNGDTQIHFIIPNSSQTSAGFKGFGIYENNALNSNGDQTTGLYRLVINKYGKVGIGTIHPTEMLTVKGKIFAEEIEVIDNVAPDYVFEPEYKLISLTDLETFINKNKHLPEIPSAENIKENHLNLGEMNNLLLKKVEELTLYIIELQKQVNELKEKE